MGQSDARRWCLVGAAACSLAWLAPTAAATPAISTDAVCLRPAQTVDGQQISPALRIAGTGFTPGASVSLTRGRKAVTGTARDDGAFDAELSVIDILGSRLPAVRNVTVRASDASGALSNTLRLKAAPLAFSASPARATPSATVRFRFSGFRPGRMIHAHYVFEGRVRVSVPMVRAKAPCGTAAVRRVQIPIAQPQVGSWSVQFDNSARYSPRSRPRIGAVIDVYAAGSR